MSQPPNTRSSSAGERHDVADLRRAPFGPLAEADGAHLRQRTDWLGKPLTNGENARDGGRADGAETDEQDAQLSAGRSDFNGCETRAKTIYQDS